MLSGKRIHWSITNISTTTDIYRHIGLPLVMIMNVYLARSLCIFQWKSNDTKRIGCILWSGGILTWWYNNFILNKVGHLVPELTQNCLKHFLIRYHKFIKYNPIYWKSRDQLCDNFESGWLTSLVWNSMRNGSLPAKKETYIHIMSKYFVLKA